MALPVKKVMMSERGKETKNMATIFHICDWLVEIYSQNTELIGVVFERSTSKHRVPLMLLMMAALNVVATRLNEKELKTLTGSDQ